MGSEMCIRDSFSFKPFSNGNSRTHDFFFNFLLVIFWIIFTALLPESLTVEIAPLPGGVEQATIVFLLLSTSWRMQKHLNRRYDGVYKPIQH